MAQIVVKPEMCGKIIDESHFKFHVTAKAKLANAINGLRKGVDLITALSKQNFTVDREWLRNSCGDPNVKVLLEILDEYKKNEHRPTRAKVLVPLIEYAIALYASDLFYRERGEWFMYQFIKRSGEMRFCSVFIDPKQWYPLTRNLSEGGTDYYKVENDPNAKTIEQEYLEWYGLDVTKDLDDIDPELVKRIISENRSWMEKQGIEFKR